MRFVNVEYIVELNNIEQSDLSGIVTFGKMSSGENKKELFTICEAVIYNIVQKEITFRKVEVEKRTVWGESDYSWVGIVTPDKWKEEMIKDQTERKLDRNVKIIMKKLGKEISKQLGIVE